MHSTRTRGGLAASTFLVALASAAALSSQDAAGQDAAIREIGTKSTAQVAGKNAPRKDDARLQELARAYRELHGSALAALEGAAKAWAPEASGSTERLRGGELLVAACADGMFAGAPSSKDGAAAPPAEEADMEGEEPVRVGAKKPAGEAVGLLLVCSTSTSRGEVVSGMDEVGAKRSREAGTKNVDGVVRDASGPIPPGVYRVLRAGSAVWLEDESGAVALRANLTPKAAPRAERAIGTRGDAAAALEDASADHGWPAIFAAITHEAMDHMGWSKHEGR